MYKWLVQFVYNALPSNVDANTRRILDITFYSRKVLHELLGDTDLKFHHNTGGILHLFKDSVALDKVIKQLTFQNSYKADMKFSILSKRECLNLEPSLEHMMKDKAYGVHMTNDESGDAHLFAEKIAAECKKLGVKFVFDTSVKAFTNFKNCITGISTDKGFMTADKFVSCVGSYSKFLLWPIGIKITIYPLKGYSLSIKTTSKHILPKISITDQERKVVYTKIGNTFRVAGTVEFDGFSHTIPEERINPLIIQTKAAFPKCGDLTDIKPFSCLRPQTPCSTPIFGRTKYFNLFLNTGHGSLGWTQALGTSKAVCDIIEGKKAEI